MTRTSIIEKRQPVIKSVQATLSAIPVTITAPAVPGYSFLCWIGLYLASGGDAGNCHFASGKVDTSTINLWANSANNSNYLATALYIPA